ncbi:hypothetical protein BH20ACI2_BH20ACI2_18950 [soil metagenome]
MFAGSAFAQTQKISEQEYDKAFAERQKQGVERQSFSTVNDGRTTMTYQLRNGFGQSVYCSSNGKSWIGPQLYECPREIRVYGPQTATSTEYSVESTVIGGKKAKVYRKFEIFKSDRGTSTFNEDLASIGPDGLFISTTQTMGDLDSKSVATRLTNTWKLNATFPPIVAPKNATPAKKHSSRAIRRRDH